MAEKEDYDKSATPIAHKTSHQDGGSDEIDVTDLVGATPRAILGDTTAGRVIRRTWITISSGTVANSIAVELIAQWNGNTLAKVDNIIKGYSGAYINLSADGNNLLIKNAVWSGYFISALSCDLMVNNSGTVLTVGHDKIAAGATFSLYHGTAGIKVDLTGTPSIFLALSMVYITSE